MLTTSIVNISCVFCATGLKFASFYASEYSRNCPHSSRSICPSHFESEADKVQRPCQILLKVSTFGLATEKYIQIAVVLVSVKCSPDHRECAKMCFPSTRSHKMSRFSWQPFGFSKNVVKFAWKP